MKLQLTPSFGQNVVTGYGAGYISINAVRHETHLLLTPETVTSWDIAGIEALDSGRAEELMAMKPEIVILGTGAALRFPDREILRRFAAAGIGFEVMDSNAACRTFNVLSAEGRRVLAAILIA